MDAFVEKLLCLLKDCTRQYNNAGSTVSDFIILGSRKLCKETSGLVVDLKMFKTRLIAYLHLFEDGGSIISHDDFAVGAE